jgi:hypothetical protein
MTIEILISIITGVLSIGIAWGITTSKVRNIEERQIKTETAYSRDHDLLVEIKTKLDMLLKGQLKDKK